MRSKVQFTFYLLTYYITLNILKIGVKPLGLYWGQNDTWDAGRADYHTSKTSTESHSYPGYHKFVFIFEIIVSLKLYIEKSYRFNLVEIIPKGRSVCMNMCSLIKRRQNAQSDPSRVTVLEFTKNSPLKLVIQFPASNLTTAYY